MRAADVFSVPRYVHSLRSFLHKALRSKNAADARRYILLGEIVENIYQTPDSELSDDQVKLARAKRGTRFLNAILDTILMLPISMLIVSPFAYFIFQNDSGQEMWDKVFTDYASFVGFSIYFLYFFLFEISMGKTPAKYITKTKVVSKTGEKPNFFQVLFRSLIRLTQIEALSFLYGKESQFGLHDLLSSTIVIKDNLKKI